MEQHEIVYRCILGGLMGFGFAMSAWFRRRADRMGGRVCRREDGSLLSFALLGSGLGSIGSLLVYLVNPAWMAWGQLDLPHWVRLAGLPLGGGALYLFYGVFEALGRNVTPTGQVRQHHTLVTHGIYRFVRHPMYASGVVLFTAYFLLTVNWFILLMCTFTFAILAARTSREEANLVGRFGDAYRAYMRTTPRFVPRLGSEQRGRTVEQGRS